MKDQIIEIGAVKLDHTGEILSRYSKFISLYRMETLPPKIVELTSITDQELLEKGEEVRSVLDDFLNYIDDCILVAQNAKFDMSFISAYKIFGKRELNGQICLDTINFGKKIFPDKSTYKLASLVEYFAVEYDANAHHRADYDAEITARVLLKQFEMLNINSETTLKELIELENADAPSIKQVAFLERLAAEKKLENKPDYHFTKQTISTQIDMLMRLPNE
ncbi:MAG: 3'-5' exonuclease [Mycoplasmatales bacterium]